LGDAGAAEVELAPISKHVPANTAVETNCFIMFFTCRFPVEEFQGVRCSSGDWACRASARAKPAIGVTSRPSFDVADSCVQVRCDVDASFGDRRAWAATVSA
jgi:hypothetical protein